MSLSLVPERLFSSYEEITPQFLQQQGITLLLSDLDYTLAHRHTEQPDEALLAWVRRLEEAGTTVMVVSNNRSGTRVSRFCDALGIVYQGHAGKPSPRGLRQAMGRAGISREHTAMLGDKLLTDVLAAKRAGVAAWMVEPAGGAVTRWQKVLHTLQAPFKAICRKKEKKKV